ncbi:MAG: 2,3-dihydroxybiphenyl 1,2-dioxygenase [Gammaproteobacteria bacterium]|nr:2,3-dihydroxybiphenyl 1,2-dioxygenase [Gammaproteobacteria bacterium]
MSNIASLGYLIFEVSDFSAWRQFAANVLGLMVCDSDAGETLSLRMDGHAHRLILQSGPADDLVAVGFEVADRDSLNDLANSLRSAGFDVLECDTAAAAERSVEMLVRTVDPNGVGIELFCGPLRADTAFVSALVPEGFVTGDEGLGHIVLNAKDHEATERFYQDLLGMRLSDRITMPIGPDQSIDINFYHANARHHTLAFTASGLPTAMHHFMIEAREMDAVGLAYDRAQRAGVPIMSTLGRHTNDRMLSFYAQTPSNFQVEFGWGGIKVDDESWQVSHYDKGSIWGHQMPAPSEHGG